MRSIDWSGTHDELWENLEAASPGVGREISRIHRSLKEHYPKRETRDYEAALLYVVAQQYDYEGAIIFEIGTCWGWTAAVMQAAAPAATVYTCTPNPNHVIISRRNLKPNYPRVVVFENRSVELLESFRDGDIDMVFVDGDHKRVSDDLPWYNKLVVSGLMIHHDYCPAAPLCTGPRPCRWVYDAVNDFSRKMHAPDVLMVDHNREGMVGHYRREEEVWRG